MLLTFAPGSRPAFFVSAYCLLLTFAPLDNGHTVQPIAAWGILQSESVICDFTRQSTRFQIKKMGGHLPRSPRRVRIYTSSPGGREYP